MADSTLRGAFELDAEQPIRQLHSIRDAGGEADAMLERLGSRMDSLPRKAATGWGGMREVVTREAGSMGRQIDELDAKMDRFARKRSRANVGISGFDRANAQLSELEGRLDRLDHRRASAHVSIGGGFSNIAGGGGGMVRGATSSTGDNGRFFSTLGGVGGALPWWAAAVPLAPQLIGGAGALIGSAASAGLGAGVLGLGAAGTFAPGLLAARPMITQAVKELGTLTKAQQTYTLAVQQFGSASTQARTAKLAYDRALAQSPPGAAGAARQFSLLRSQWSSYTAPGLYGSMAQGISDVRRALPQLGPLAGSATSAAGANAAQFVGFLTNPQSIRSYQTLVASFVQDLPLVEGTLQNVTRTFLNLSVSAQPFFRDALVWVDHWTAGMARSSGDTAKVSSEMGKMVTSAKDWGRLLLSAEHTLRDLFAPSVTPGNSMVTDLTNTLNTWDQWLKSNPQKVQGFFRDGEQSVSQIASVIKNLTGDVWQLFRYLQPIFNRAEQFLKFASGLGGGNLALGGALLYGGYSGIRGALGGRGPSAGALASTLVFGPGARTAERFAGGNVIGASTPSVGRVYSAAAAARSATTLVPPIGFQSEARAVGAGEQMALFAMLGGRTITPYEQRLVTPTLSTPSAFMAKYGNIPGARPGLPVSTVTRAELMDQGAIQATGFEKALSLGGGLLRGVGKFALPVLGISALLGALQPTTGGISARAQNALSGLTLGLVPNYVSPQVQGAQTAQNFLQGLPPGVSPYSAISQRIRQIQLSGMTPTERAAVARGQLTPITPMPGLQTAYSANPLLRGPVVSGLTTQQVSQISALAQAQMAQLAHQAGAVTTPQGAQRIAQQVAQVRLELPADQARHFSAYLQQIADTAAKNAGASASNSWQQAFGMALQRGRSPQSIVATELTGMLGELKHLGPKGAQQFAQSTAQWAQQMELDNPKLRAPLEKLMAGITADMNRMDDTTGHTMRDLRDKTFYFNGQILQGAGTAWDAISGVVENKNQRMLAKLEGIWGTLQSEVIKALSGLGFSPAQARQIAQMASSGQTGALLANAAVSGVRSGQSTSTALNFHLSANPAVSGVRPNARGGRIGGTGLMDTVALPDGSVAAPGEAWIANRHTMGDLDLAARAYYGKPAWEMIRDEQRPHSWPLRGTPSGRQRAAFGLSGGPSAYSGQVILDPGVNMSVGQEPQIRADLQRLSAELHQVVYVISGYRSPAHSVSVGGFANDPHTRGQAADIGVGSPSRSSMFGVSDAQLRAVGLYRPFYPASAAEVNHVQLLAGGQAGSPVNGTAGLGGFAPMQISLRAPRSGLGGIPGAMGDQAARVITMGMQQRVNRLIGAMGPRGGGSTAGLSGSLVAMVNQLSRRFGWGGAQAQDWLNVINAESGGSMTATNPSSGAYGLGQGITGPGWYYTYGGNPNTQAGQLLGMGNYMRQRYGDPAAAWAHEQSAHWYSRGGRWAGWNAQGGEFITQGPTRFGAGEREKERVTITPIRRGGAAQSSGRQIHVNFNGPVHFGGSRAELDKVARYVAKRILDAMDDAQDGHDNDLIEAPS